MLAAVPRLLKRDMTPYICNNFFLALLPLCLLATLFCGYYVFHGERLSAQYFKKCGLILFRLH